MRKSVILSIPTPCHAKWEDMAPTEKGRFCASCQSTVFDFTNLSENEIAAIALSEKDICIAAYPSQLNRQAIIPKGPLFAASLVLAGMLALSTSQASAQTNPVTKEQVVPVPEVSPKKGEFIINGTVSDGVTPLADIVILRVKNRGKKRVKILIETKTAIDGTFSVNVKEGEFLIFAHNDYEFALVDIVSQMAEIKVKLIKKEPGVIRLGRLQADTTEPFKYFHDRHNFR